MLGGGLHGLRIFGLLGEGFLQENLLLSGLQTAHVGIETVS